MWAPGKHLPTHSPTASSRGAPRSGTTPARAAPPHQKRAREESADAPAPRCPSPDRAAYSQRTDSPWLWFARLLLSPDESRGQGAMPCQASRSHSLPLLLWLQRTMQDKEPDLAKQAADKIRYARPPCTTTTPPISTANTPVSDAYTFISTANTPFSTATTPFSSASTPCRGFGAQVHGGDGCAQAGPPARAGGRGRGMRGDLVRGSGAGGAQPWPSLPDPTWRMNPNLRGLRPPQRPQTLAQRPLKPPQRPPRPSTPLPTASTTSARWAALPV